MKKEEQIRYIKKVTWEQEPNYILLVLGILLVIILFIYSNEIEAIKLFIDGVEGFNERYYNFFIVSILCSVAFLTIISVGLIDYSLGRGRKEYFEPIKEEVKQIK